MITNLDAQRIEQLKSLLSKAATTETAITESDLKNIHDGWSAFLDEAINSRETMDEFLAKNWSAYGTLFVLGLISNIKPSSLPWPDVDAQTMKEKQEAFYKTTIDNFIAVSLGNVNADDFQRYEIFKRDVGYYFELEPTQEQELLLRIIIAANLANEICQTEDKGKRSFAILSLFAQYERIRYLANTIDTKHSEFHDTIQMYNEHASKNIDKMLAEGNMKVYEGQLYALGISSNPSPIAQFLDIY